MLLSIIRLLRKHESVVLASIQNVTCRERGVGVLVLEFAQLVVEREAGVARRFARVLRAQALELELRLGLAHELLVALDERLVYRPALQRFDRFLSHVWTMRAAAARWLLGRTLAQHPRLHWDQRLGLEVPFQGLKSVPTRLQLVLQLHCLNTGQTDQYFIVPYRSQCRCTLQCEPHEQ